MKCRNEINDKDATALTYLSQPEVRMVLSSRMKLYSGDERLKVDHLNITHLMYWDIPP